MKEVAGNYRAAARFWTATCERAPNWIKEAYWGQGNLELRWWECGIERRARDGKIWVES